MPNQASQELEQKVLAMTRQFPSYSYNRIAAQLQLEGVAISGGGVRCIWLRHNLTKRLARFLWLEKETMEGRGMMTENALKAIAKVKRLQEASDNHVEAHTPGELLSQDLYLVGHIKGVGKVYMQAAVDCSCSVAFAQLCVNKLPISSVALVHEKVLPFYDQLEVPVRAILTDCGREYCGRVDKHLFELYLAAQAISHRTTRPASPYTNGFAERFHQTLKNEFFAKTFREKGYTSVEDLQKDLDTFMHFYNHARSHSGYRCEGRTPMETLKLLLEGPMREEVEWSCPVNAEHP